MKSIFKSLSFRKDVARDLSNRKFEFAPEGLYLATVRGFARGVYADHVIRGGQVIDFGLTDNTVVDQGFVDLLNTMFGATSKKAGFYTALFAGAVTPATNWTASGFAATASEITSNSEGYTQSTRPQWTPAVATTPQMDNYAAKAAFTIATASVLNVNGAAILSDSGKGSTAGVLISAARYANTRQLQNGDNYEVGYRISFASA